MTVFDDIKTSKLWILGVIALATGVGTFLTTVCNFPLAETVTFTASVAILCIFISWLVDRSEKRQTAALKAHEVSANERIAKYDIQLKQLLAYARESQMSNLRLEMDSTIDHNPSDHTTILKFAEKYFVELGGDWVQTDIFIKWVKDEEAAGRPVHIPPDLLAKVRAVKASES